MTSIKGKEESVDLTVLAGDRNSILVAVCFPGVELGLATASGVSSGLSRTRDVRCWHIADIDADDEHVRFWG